MTLNIVFDYYDKFIKKYFSTRDDKYIQTKKINCQATKYFYDYIAYKYKTYHRLRN